MCVLSHAEQLVLYLKSAELLSAALQTAMERVKQGKLYPSTTVKQGTSCFICLGEGLVKASHIKNTFFLSLYSREEAERAVQVQRGILPLAQHPSGALLFQETPSDGPNHLHHSRAAAVQPHGADGEPAESSRYCVC